MNGTTPIDLADFKNLVLAAMTLAAAGLAGDQLHQTEFTDKVRVEIPYRSNDKAEVIDGIHNAPFIDIVTVLCDRFEVTHPRPRDGGKYWNHEIVTLERSGEPSAHETIAAVDLLQTALEDLGLAKPVIKGLLLLRS